MFPEFERSANLSLTFPPGINVPPPCTTAGFAETWTYLDESFTAYSPMIRFVLDYKNESRPSLSLFTPLGEYGTSALETGADLREEKLLDQLFPRLRVHNHTTLHGPHHNHTAAAKAHNHKKHAAHAPGVDTEGAGLDP